MGAVLRSRLVLAGVVFLVLWVVCSLLEWAGVIRPLDLFFTDRYVPVDRVLALAGAFCLAAGAATIALSRLLARRRGS